MTITATQVLEMLATAQKLGACPIVGKEQKEGCYVITFWYDFYGSGGETESVYITNEGTSSRNGSYHFDTMMNILDKKLEEQEQEKIKVEKRKELIARLSDEERELLGVK